MDSAKPHSLRSRLLTGCAVLLALPVLYLLSTGPVVYVVARYGLNGPRAGTYFRPLEWAFTNTPLQRPLDEYLEWWWHSGELRYRHDYHLQDAPE